MGYISTKECQKSEFKNEKAIICIWTEFASGETKNIDFTISSPKSNKFETTLSTTIYDPFKSSGFYKGIEFIFSSFKHLFELIYLHIIHILLQIEKV